MRKKIEIAGDRHLETLRNCGGYYACPQNQGTEAERIGPLVGYTGTYEAQDGSRRHWVGDVYANFAKAEPYTNVMKFFASTLSERICAAIGLDDIDVFCGAPIGGYSLADALGFCNDIDVIKAEKKVTAVATDASREEFRITFSRHEVMPGWRVVIVEDVCNNFSTTDQIIANIILRGGEVVAIACFLNRSLKVDDLYVPGEVYLTDGRELGNMRLPVVSLVRLPIHQWKQDDPAVVDDVARGNVVWKPKDGIA